MADYLADYEFAKEMLSEDGASATMEWEEYTKNDNTGAMTLSGSYVEDIFIVVLPIPYRGRTLQDVLTFKDKKSFIAAPKSPSVAMANQRRVVVNGVTYEIESCDGLAPDGTQVVIYQGLLRTGT